MTVDDEQRRVEFEVPVIDLSAAPGEHAAWDRPKFIVYLWAVVELLLVTNPWQVSSGIRVGALRLFGAKIGEGVVFRPRTRVKFPWKLSIGDRSWIGEGVWLHNQDEIWIGHDVVVSQEAFVTTGSHAHREDMALITRRVVIDNGAWVTTRVIISGGAIVPRNCVITPNSVVGMGDSLLENTIVRGNPAKSLGPRFPNLLNGDK